MEEITLDMVKELMDDKYHLLYFGYEDDLDNQHEAIMRCIEEESSEHLHDRFDYWYGDCEYSAVTEILQDLKKQLVSLGYRLWEAEKFFDEYGQDVREEIYSRSTSDGLGELIENSDDIPVRLELLSNYDCINSHWLESSGGYSYCESYFGDMVDTLNLNPRKVKKILTENSVTVVGRFPDKRGRDGKELVSYGDFYRELVNSCCGANLLIFVSKLNIKELYENDFRIDKVKIPKGNRCGLFSSCYGGGSLLEMELKQDIEIPLGKKEYPRYRLEVESRENRYHFSLDEVYGVCNSFYGNTATLVAGPKAADRLTA